MDESMPEPPVDGALTPPPPRLLLPTPARKVDLSALVNRALDQLDTIADRIANAAGLR
jgi:hypothetical protein